MSKKLVKFHSFFDTKYIIFLTHLQNIKKKKKNAKTQHVKNQNFATKKNIRVGDGGGRKSTFYILCVIYTLPRLYLT